MFAKNQILYGPPGTGKTYNTVIYAVAICDNKTLSEVNKQPYEEILKRYNELKNENRIFFTTFHQSYGYEEFIEGIRPVIDQNSDSKNISYSIEPGLFKKFCSQAQQITITEDGVKDGVAVNSNPNIWSIILGGNESPELKQQCFVEGTIRIGWFEHPQVITDDTINLTEAAKRVLLNFQDEMKIGDIVVARSSSTTIDGIGIISSQALYDQTNSKYPRKRYVNWIIKDKSIDISDLNEGYNLGRSTIYQLSRISVEKLFSKLPSNSNFKVKNETTPYVFIIDEINRGNISKIFGELITLIEPTKRKGEKEQMEVILPYSKQPFSVPNNVYILGTMNTADRSIAMIDTALRRRFSFIELQPDPEILISYGIGTICIDGKKLNIAEMLKVINRRIEILYDREHTIGHAFFCSLKNKPTIDMESLADIFLNQIIPLLKEYFYEDYSKIQLILGDNNKKEELKFISNINTDKVFSGNYVDIEQDKPIYSINEKNFLNIDSYKQIAEGL